MEDIPWVGLVQECYYTHNRFPGSINSGSFWWRDVTKLIGKFKGLAKVNLHDGMTCLLWTDMWQDIILEINFPELYSFAKNKRITLSEARNSDSLQSLFHLPLFEEAFPQFPQLQSMLDSIQTSDSKDYWGFIWGQTSYLLQEFISNSV